MALKPRRGPRQMPLATKPHGPKGKRNPDDIQEQLDDMIEDAREFMDTYKEALDKLDDNIWIYDTCPYMLATEGDDSKCYCSARAREHCKREI